MNATSHIQLRSILSPAVASIALLVCAILLPMASLSPAAPIDESYQYDALNRLTAAGAATYQHDAAGNLVQMTGPANTQLFVTPNTRTVTYTPNSATTVSLTANVSWTASSNQTWLTVTPGSGTTGATLTLTATTQNPTTSARSAVVTITGGSLSSQVTVTQDGAPPANTLTVTPTSITVLSAASSVYGCGVNITTGAWTSVSDQPWLTLTTSSGSGNGSILFTITENTTAALRTAHVTVTSGAQTAIFTLYQQASSVVDDHGGSIATATPIPPTASSAPGMLTAADEDFFRVTAPGPGIIIAWSESSIDTYGHLYNSAGTQVDEDNDSDVGTNFRVSAGVTAGNYYVRLKGNAANTAGTYILRTRFIPNTDPIQVSYLEKASNDVNLGFTGSAGVTYYILGSDDLKEWTQIATMVGTGAENYATLVGQGGMPKRFFRVGTAAPASDFNYTAAAGTITITGYKGAGGAVLIPNTINGMPVTKIDDSAFIYKSSISSVLVPTGVVSIGDSAFRGITNLTNIILPGGLSFIRSGAFLDCSRLTNITIPIGVTAINDNTFMRCSKLSSVSIPAGVTSIGGGAFVDCSSLTSITIPSGVTTIGDMAFLRCAGLGSVNFRGNAPVLGSSVFLNTAAGFTVHYSNTSSGFTSPTWQGYPAQVKAP